MAHHGAILQLHSTRPLSKATSLQAFLPGLGVQSLARKKSKFVKCHSKICAHRHAITHHNTPADTNFRAFRRGKRCSSHCSKCHMGHGQYLVYSSKWSIFEEWFIVFQVLVYGQMLSIFEECTIVFQAPAQFPKNKDLSLYDSPLT